MKHKLRKNLKFNFLSLGLLMLLTNCQTEELTLKNESHIKSSAVVTNLNYDEFLKQRNVKSTVERLKKIELSKINSSKNSNNTQRSVVVIDSTSINQVIKDDIISYTFKVINNNLEPNTFENLVIQTNTNQQTDAYLIKYTPSISLAFGIPFQGIREVTPLDDNTVINSSTTNKTTVCVSITTYTNYYLCDEGVPQTPETCDYQYTTEDTETSCETLPDGNSNSTVFYSNYSSGSGSGTSGGNDSNYDGSDPNIHGNGGTGPINTAPLLEEEEIIRDPCKKVKAPFIKVPTLAQQNKNLALNTTQPIEYGFYMMNNANSTTISPFTNLTNGTHGSVEFPENPLPSNPILVLSHTHNSPANSTYSVPSWEDLDNLSYYMQQYPTTIDNNIVFITITADGTRFAITINNIQKFKDFFYWGMKFDPSNFDSAKLKNKNENFARFYNGDPLQNPPIKPLITENSAYPEQDLRYFLNMLQSNDAGVDVFEVNSDFTTFTKVVFDKITNNIIRTNCN